MSAGDKVGMNLCKSSLQGQNMKCSRRPRKRLKERFEDN